MTSLLSVAIGAEVSLVEITGPSAEFIVMDEKGSVEEAALGGEVFLLDPGLGCPVWMSNLDGP